MSAVQNTALRVIEAAEQQHQPNGNVGDVGKRNDQLPIGIQQRVALNQNAIRRAQVLQNVQQQHAIEAFVSQTIDHRGDAIVQIGAKVLLESGSVRRLR